MYLHSELLSDTFGRLPGKNIVLATILAIASQASCSAGESTMPEDGVVWRWHESNTELYSPEFSLDVTEIVLVRKRHGLDGHEAELAPKARLREQTNLIESDERYEDPQIVVLDQYGLTDVIDWGWAPTFSADGKQVAYAAQTKPISGLRVLAGTLAGNEIRVRNRSSKTNRTLAKPETAYLSDPLFSPDGQYVVYSIGGATNGAYGGNIGLARAALDSAESETLYSPTKDHDLFHLVDPKRFVSGRLLAVRCTPAGEGLYLADEYDCDLLDVGPPQSTVYSWGRRPSHQIRPLEFTEDPEGKLLVYDQGWQTVGSHLQPRALPHNGSRRRPAIASPNAEFVADVSESTVTIRELANDVVRREWEFGSRIQDLVWSRSSRHIAVIITHYKDQEQIQFDYDELVVLEL